MPTYLITWTTHGSWLPGDPRGWVAADRAGIQQGDGRRLSRSRERMGEDAVRLDVAQRDIIERTIRDHATHRRWMLHAINVRSNHLHLVVDASVAPEKVMSELKAWCSRRLNEHQPRAQASDQHKWWTRHGSTKWIRDDACLRNAIRYVNERQ